MKYKQVDSCFVFLIFHLWKKSCIVPYHVPTKTMHFFSRRNWQLGLVGQILVYTNPNKNAKKERNFSCSPHYMSNLLGLLFSLLLNCLLIRLFVCVYLVTKPPQKSPIFVVVNGLFFEYSMHVTYFQQVKETRQLVGRE